MIIKILWSLKYNHILLMQLTKMVMVYSMHPIFSIFYFGLLASAEEQPESLNRVLGLLGYNPFVGGPPNVWSEMLECRLQERKALKDTPVPVSLLRGLNGYLNYLLAIMSEKREEGLTTKEKLALLHKLKYKLRKQKVRSIERRPHIFVLAKLARRYIDTLVWMLLFEEGNESPAVLDQRFRDFSLYEHFLRNVKMMFRPTDSTNSNWRLTEVGQAVIYLLDSMQGNPEYDDD